MKRWAWLLIVFLLAACGGDDASRPTAEPPATVSVTPVARPMALTPTLAVPSAVPTATSLLPAARATSAPTLAPTILAPAPTRPAAEPTALPPPFSAAPLPLLTAQVTLGPPILPCFGNGLYVGDDGRVYTLGWRAGQPCASAIDLTTGMVEPADPAAFPPAAEELLEVTDLTRGRVYVAEEGVVTAFDAGGQALGPVLSLPPGEPDWFSALTALRLDEAADRLYLSYQDFDGDAWVAMADLASGTTIADVPVPAGPWALTHDGRLLFAGANTLVVVDGLTLEITYRLSLSRRPADAVVDPATGHVLVTDAGGDLHVLDVASLAELERLPGLGAALDLDARLGRLYVGDRFSGGVHVFDLSTLRQAQGRLLERLGSIPQPGQPVASPADGRLYILEEAVYQADGATLQLVSQRTARKGGCNGCTYPTGVAVDPNTGLVYTTTYSVWVGKPGRTSQATVDPLTGRAFVARTTGGYQVVYSLAAYPDLSLSAAPDRWIDGLYGQPLYNPLSDQLYLAQGGRLLVLDGQTLAFLGGVNVGEGLALLAVDVDSGQLYAAQGERLLRFEMEGAALDVPAPEPVEGLPGPVYGIAVSPAFAQDNILFVRATEWDSGRSDLYRSRDGGRSWVRLMGGLPGPPNALAFAPDGRLYAALVPIGWGGAPESASWGEGVYVSEDGGDTWAPDNPGLTHLRVGRLHVADDGTLYALAAAAAEPGHAASGPTIWTRASGQAWTPLPVPDAGPLRLVDYTLPATYTLAVNAYWHNLTGGGPLYQSWGEELRRSDDGGQTWRAVGRGPADYANEVVSSRAGASVYWVGPDALWRSTDEGTTWAASRHPALAGGPPFSVVVADVDGIETLFLGSEAGQVLILPVAEGQWEEVDSLP